ncbi:hypothetical protein A3715_19735 [Oleiphilus sp. HI0009]|nr:hypothetical protein A3715_19735 [Oleiphilus sp. HI0009]
MKITDKLIQEIQLNPENYQVLERVPSYKEDDILYEENNDDLVRFCAIDTETTGLSLENDIAIELGLVEFFVNQNTGLIHKIGRCYNGLEDPKKPLDDEVIEFTGITDEDLKGQAFDDKVVNEILSDDPIMVAHNAKFDASIIKKRFEKTSNLRWVCSIKDVEWLKLGYKGRSLESLLKHSGYFYDAHRAITDCFALIKLLSMNELAVIDLINAEKAERYVVHAFGNTFHAKDALKARGYQWDDGSGKQPKHWWNETEEPDDEMEHLSTLFDTSSVIISIKTSRDRY